MMGYDVEPISENQPCGECGHELEWHDDVEQQNDYDEHKKLRIHICRAVTECEYHRRTKPNRHTYERDLTIPKYYNIHSHEFDRDQQKWWKGVRQCVDNKLGCVEECDCIEFDENWQPDYDDYDDDR